MDAAARCPCGSGDTYGDCCGPLHAGGKPPTARALMQSRFSAFAVGDREYLLGTWHPSTRPATLTLDDAIRWTRLDVLAVDAGGPFDTSGTVEFEAHYRTAAGRGSQRERSRFVREDGWWLYVSGSTSTV